MNALLQRLQIDLPLFQGPMTGSDTPQLAAAVSQAGGLGFLGCGMRSPHAMRKAAASQGRADYLSLWAGQGVAAARALPAQQLVALLAQEWQAALRRLKV